MAFCIKETEHLYKADTKTRGNLGETECKATAQGLHHNYVLLKIRKLSLVLASSYVNRTWVPYASHNHTRMLTWHHANQIAHYIKNCYISFSARSVNEGIRNIENMITLSWVIHRNYWCMKTRGHNFVGQNFNIQLVSFGNNGCSHWFSTGELNWELVLETQKKEHLCCQMNILTKLTKRSKNVFLGMGWEWGKGGWGRDVNLNTHLSCALMKCIWRVFNLTPHCSQANIGNTSIRE